MNFITHSEIMRVTNLSRPRSLIILKSIKDMFELKRHQRPTTANLAEYLGVTENDILTDLNLKL
jgi:hypothetical protein